MRSRIDAAPAYLPFLFLLILGLVFAFRPILFSGFSLMQSDSGDTRVNEYILEHSFRWLTGDPLHSQYWNSPFFFPVQNVAAYTDVLLGTAPIYWLCRFLTFAPDTSFQLWLLLISILNYVVSYLFLKRIFRFDPLPCSIGAFLFAFGSPRIGQLGHEQLFAQFWTVLAIWAIFRGIQSSRFLLLAFVCLVFQLYSSFYLGWFLTFGIYVATVFCLAHPRFRKTTILFFLSSWKTLLVGGIISAIALSPMAYHYYLASQVLGPRTFAEVESYAPRIQSWFYLGQFSWLYSWEHYTTPIIHLYAPHEQRLGLGFVTLTLFLIAFFKRRNEKVFRLFFGLTFLMVLLTTRVFHHGGWLWYIFGYRGFPGGIGIRSLSRVSMLLLVPAMIGIAAYFQKYRGRFGLILMALVITEQGQSLEYFNKAENREKIAAASQEIPEDCKSFYLVAPNSTEADYNIQILAMWASLERGIPTINGYSGNMPPGWNFPGAHENDLSHWLIRNHLLASDVCIVRTWVERSETQIY